MFFQFYRASTVLVKHPCIPRKSKPMLIHNHCGNPTEYQPECQKGLPKKNMMFLAKSCFLPALSNFPVFCSPVLDSSRRIHHTLKGLANRGISTAVASKSRQRQQGKAQYKSREQFYFFFTLPPLYHCRIKAVYHIYIVNSRDTLLLRKLQNIQIPIRVYALPAIGCLF